MAVEAAFFRLGFHRLAHESGQAGKLRLVMQGEREALLVGEHILAERRAELRQPLDDLRQALFRLALERGAGAAEGRVIALEYALLLGGEVKRLALLHQSIDATEQLRIGVEPVPVVRDLWRELALDRKQRLIAVGAGQKVEHLLDPCQRPAGELERCDGIAEIRRCSAARDGRDLGLVLGEGPRVGWCEMLWLDLCKGRRLAGGGPGPEKGVVALLLRVHAGLSPRRKCRVLYRDFRLELGPYFGESAAASEEP